MDNPSQRHEPASLEDCSFLGPALPELFAASLFLNLLGLALPLALLQVYDRIIPQAATGTMELLFFGVTVAIALETVLRIARSDLAAWLGARFEHAAGCAAMARLTKAVIADVEREGSGVHLERWNALTTVKESYSGQNLLLLLDLPFALLYLGMIWLIAGPLVLAPACVLLLFLLTAWLSGRLLRRSLEGRGQADERRFNFIIEVLAGAHTVKSMAMENLMQRRHERLQENCSEWDARVARSNAAAQTSTAFFSQLATVCVVAMGALSIMEGSMTTGALAACVMLTSRSLQPIAKAMGIWSRYQAVRLAHRRLGELFALPTETSSGQVRPAEIQGEIELRALSFGYVPDLPPCIDNVSIQIAAGECIAITGANGSGKSTLLSIMHGALPVQAGQVLLDGVALTDLEAGCRRETIAFIPQHGVLFRGTLLENITLFRPALVDAAIAVAGRLGLDQVVRTMPLGYNTRIDGGAGDSLPRGIKQRIAVARALVTQPKVVLFDDANTGVDSSGDTCLRACLEGLKGRCTLVLVTHRPSLLRLADRTFELRNGQLHQRSTATPAPADHGRQPVLELATE